MPDNKIQMTEICKLSTFPKNVVSMGRSGFIRPEKKEYKKAMLGVPVAFNKG